MKEWLIRLLLVPLIACLSAPLWGPILLPHVASPQPTPATAPTAADLLARDTARAGDFRVQLLAAMDTQPNLHPLAQKRLKAVLNGPDSPKKAALLRHLERHARAHLIEQHLVQGNIEIDWSKIDWQKLLTQVLQILIMLLPFLLTL